jgi:hypothetical protein
MRDPSDQQAQAVAEPAALAGRERFDVSWWTWTAAFALVGLSVRLYSAHGVFLNPDEALHCVIAAQPDLGAVYDASLTNAHPPLLYLLLHLWMFLGRGELFLRLVSVFAGAAFGVVAAMWAHRELDERVGRMVVVLCAFAPPLVQLSAEVRHYSLMLVLFAASLLGFDAALRRRSTMLLALSSAALYGALLTHYSAVWLAAALGFYGLLRRWDGQLRGRLLATWVALQVVGACLFGWVAASHVAVLRGSSMEREAVEGWLAGYYFHPESGGILRFMARRTADFFVWLAGGRAAGVVCALLAGLALLLLALQAWSARRSFGARFVCQGWFESLVRRCLPKIRWPKTGLQPAVENVASHTVQRSADKPAAVLARLGLLLSPFLLTCGAALGGLYPYGGTRHVAVLALPALTLIGLALAHLAGRRGTATNVVALAAAAWWLLSPAELRQAIPRVEQNVRLMTDSVAYLREQARPGATVFVDHQSSQLLGYYLADGPEEVAGTPRLTPISVSAGSGCPSFQILDLSYGGLRVLASTTWTLDKAGFNAQLRKLVETGVIDARQQVWVFDAGWGDNLAELLDDTTRFAIAPTLRSFGPRISVWRLPENALVQAGQPGTAQAQ